MTLRRVMGLVDNGEYFAQCASKLCKHRVWLKPGVDTPDGAATQEQVGAGDLAYDSAEAAQSCRWTRHLQVEPSELNGLENESETPVFLFVQRARTGEFIHGRKGLAQTGKHLLGVPDLKGIVQTLSVQSREEQHGSGTCTPVTSGAEELLDDEEEVQASPPDLNVLFQKRWSRMGSAAGGSCQHSDTLAKGAVSTDRSMDRAVIIKAFPSVSCSLIEDLIREGLTLDEVIECLACPGKPAGFA